MNSLFLRLAGAAALITTIAKILVAVGVMIPYFSFVGVNSYLFYGLAGGLAMAAFTFHPVAVLGAALAVSLIFLQVGF